MPRAQSGGHSEWLRLLSCGDLRCRGRGVALRSVFQRAETAVQIGQALGYDIRQILLVQIVRRVHGLVVDAHHLGGHAHSGAVGRQIAQHHAACADAGVVPDIHRAKDLGACTDQHVVAQSGVALAGVLAGAAQSDTVVDGAVVPDLAGLAEHDAHAVINEQASADGGTGVDLDAGAAAAMLADPPGQKEPLVLV